MRDRQESIGRHLVELQRRVMRAGVAIVVFTVIALIFHEHLLVLLMEPAQQFASVPNQKPIYTEPTEFIGVAMKVSFLVGIFASLPWVLYQIVMFVAPGMTAEEKRYLYLLLPASVLVFLVGAAFGYRVIFPPMVKFLLTFGADVVTPFIRIGSYVGLMTRLLFWMGLIFEMPLVVFFLARIGMVRPEVLGKQRRYALVGAFVLGALITPTFDPINQSLVAVPILVLYEVSILLAKLGRRGHRRASIKRDASST